MLRIKKEVDLKELEKFGFTINQFCLDEVRCLHPRAYKKIYIGKYDYDILVLQDNVICLFGYYGQYELKEKRIKDLIQAGLVEKVVE